MLWRPWACPLGRLTRSTFVRSTDSVSDSWRSISFTASGSEFHVQQGVDALAVLVDLVGQAALTPYIDLLDGSADVRITLE